MPSNFTLKTMNAVHRGLLKVTGGKVGNSLYGMPVLELHTTGAKSGQPRSCMLTSPIQDGDKIIIIASRGGDPVSPGWYHNILANPDVEIVIDGERRKMRGRVATPEERAEYWPRVTAKYKGYAGYEKRTTRVIPVVILEPR